MFFLTKKFRRKNFRVKKFEIFCLQPICNYILTMKHWYRTPHYKLTRHRQQFEKNELIERDYMYWGQTRLWLEISVLQSIVLVWKNAITILFEYIRPNSEMIFLLFCFVVHFNFVGRFVDWNILCWNWGLLNLLSFYEFILVECLFFSLLL